ncbi:MAG: DMT family transporter [Spirochaetes bacterium]|nr:DMT family transporter [Spirochaetota bacterium]MBU0955718.1 DMT family transporter [Spirochaetota bacterium]
MKAAALKSGQHEPRAMQGFLLALLSALTFSSLGLFAKLIYSQGFSVPQSLAWRFSLAALLLWIFVLATGRWRKPAALYRRLFLLGLFGFAPQAGLYFLTLRYLDPGLASLLLYLYPAFVIIAVLLMYRRKPSRRQLLALLLAMVGCVLTLWKSAELPVQGLVFGLILALAYALYLTASEKALKGIDPIFATAVIMAAAALFYWSITLVTGTLRLPSTTVAFAGILGIAVVATILPIVTLFASMERIGSADASLVSTAEPLFTIALSAVLLGERLSPLQLAGGACIISALLVLQVGRRMQVPLPGALPDSAE